MKVRACPLPPDSRIHAALAGADFADCYTFADPQPLATALDTYLALVARTPRWMDALMALRNQTVRWFGLKHLGALGSPRAPKAGVTYRPGDRVGIFTLEQNDPRELILFDDDKHLLVQLSLYKHTVAGQAMVSLSTVVHIHNRLGRVYMSLVGPVHRRIVPRMLMQAAHG